MDQAHIQNISLYAVLESHALYHPANDAVIIENTKLSYSALLERVTLFSGWLLLNGVAPDEVTGICVRDEINHLVCALALLCMGTPQISLGSHENVETKRQLAKKVGVTQLIGEKVESWMAGLRTLVVPRGQIIQRPHVAERELFRARMLGSVAVYSNTSGTTSLPKTFEISYGRLNESAYRYATDLKEKRSLRFGSVEFDSSRLNRICSVLAGNTTIGLRQCAVDRLVSVCERESVSVVRVGPYRLASLLRSSTSGRRLPQATTIIASGSRVCGALRKQVRAELSENLWVQYSTSETGVISIAAPHQHDVYPESVGFPEPGVTVEIVGPEDELVPNGAIGDSRVRKATMASGYRAETSAYSKFREDWFYPGDLLSREPDGTLIFHGRADDVIILNGINIFPSVIEDALEGLPSVREAVAFPVKSRIHGEIPVAAVVLSDKAEDDEISRILHYCQQLLGVRAPREIRVVDSIPRNAVGKPLRSVLAA